MAEHTGPDAPHWGVFKRVDPAPNDWSFRFLEEGVACIENDEHRFVVATDLVQRERTADRYFTVYYEPADVDPIDEDEYQNSRVPFNHGKNAEIVRNNIFAARDAVEHPDSIPHVVVVEEDDEQTVYDVPASATAEFAADLYTRVSLDTDREISSWAYTREEWEERQELKKQVEQ